MTLPTPINLTVLGDAGVGKTALLLSFTLDLFSSTYLPTCIEGLVAKVEKNSQSFEIHLYDTPGGNYDEVCRVLYPDKKDRLFINALHPTPDVVLVCYSVTSPATLQSVKDKWVSELKKRLPGIPWLLVGTKIDRRDNVKPKPPGLLTQEEGVAAAETLGAMGYLECSSFTQDGVKAILDEVVMAPRQPREEKKKKKSSCLIQ
ncbi:Rho GTPase [Aspergillus nanangensis]|uniref:Rho GTPase n=1 Tax=Aspergillus nanangensis TaxID=2582783 RepID=A0AAD4CRN0_ASPNN|nr:Rho GTPase [Aspergillus nanangensis]